jgi:protein-S-isoprenylcysteine O-methyltransferase Ste14
VTWPEGAAYGLIGLSIVADIALARRYAGGRSQDGLLWALLSISLIGNMALVIGLSRAGIGRLPDAAALILAPLGVGLGLAGLWLRYAAIFTLGRFFTWRVTILEEHSLIESGVFAWLRHPGYVGGLVASYGFILALSNWASLLVFTATHVPLVINRIRVEERVLLRHFAERYVAYRDKTWF